MTMAIPKPASESPSLPRPILGFVGSNEGKKCGDEVCSPSLSVLVPGWTVQTQRDRCTSSRGLNLRRRRRQSAKDSAHRQRNLVWTFHFRGVLLPAQVDVPNPDVGAQLVFAVAAILQRLAQPAAGLTVAVAVDVADARAGLDQSISRVLSSDANVADTQLHILITVDVFDGQVANFFVHVEIRIRGNFQFHVELRIAAGRRMKVQNSIVATNLEVDPRVLDVSFMT